MSEIPFGSLQQRLIGKLSHTSFEEHPREQRTDQAKRQQDPGAHQQQTGGLPDNQQDHRDNQEYRALLGFLHTLRFRRSADDKGHRYQRNGWSEEQQDNQPTDARY